MESDSASKPQSWFGRRNWWKIGCIVLLFGFEVCREFIVIQSQAKAEPNVSFFLFQSGDWTNATGTWQRIDAGGAMEPSTVAVQCYRDEGKCFVATASMNGLHVFAPDISRFDAVFGNDNITFDDDNATCVTLRYRIDIKLNTVNAVRESKPSGTRDPLCAKLEKRVSLTLGDSPLNYGEASRGSFLPVLNSIFWLAEKL